MLRLVVGSLFLPFSLPKDAPHIVESLDLSFVGHTPSGKAAVFFAHGDHSTTHVLKAFGRHCFPNATATILNCRPHICCQRGATTTIESCAKGSKVAELSAILAHGEEVGLNLIHPFNTSGDGFSQSSSSLKTWSIPHVEGLIIEIPYEKPGGSILRDIPYQRRLWLHIQFHHCDAHAIYAASTTIETGSDADRSKSITTVMMMSKSTATRRQLLATRDGKIHNETSSGIAFQSALYANHSSFRNIAINTSSDGVEAEVRNIDRSGAVSSLSINDNINDHSGNATTTNGPIGSNKSGNLKTVTKTYQDIPDNAMNPGLHRHHERINAAAVRDNNSSTQRRRLELFVKTRLVFQPRFVDVLLVAHFNNFISQEIVDDFVSLHEYAFPNLILVSSHPDAKKYRATRPHIGGFHTDVDTTKVRQ
jgi:hypothetical protein